jgi:3-oxoadipate enol-lactonase
MLFHEQHGAGPAVLLVHAGVADSRMWAGVVPRLAEAHRVIACDLRGFGRSPLEPGPYSHGGDLLALLDALGVERPAVVAASMGGAFALELALHAPERVTALALLDSALDENGERSPEFAAYIEAEGTALEAGDVDAAAEATLRTWVDGRGRAGAVDPEVRALVGVMYRDWAAHQLAAEEDEEEELEAGAASRLAEISVPALIAIGEHDLEDFARNARRLAEALPGARPVVTVAGAAHLPALERPDEVTELLLAFLAEAG